MILPVPPMMTPAAPRAKEPESDGKTKVYLVSGFTGEYEDKHDWEVSAFLSEARAKALAAKLNDWLLANHFHFDTPNNERASDLDVVCPLDPRFHSNSYTGTRYFVWSVNIEDAP